MIEIVRVVTNSQIESVAALADQIWREHYTPIIGAEQVAYMLENFQSPEAVRAQIDRNELIYYLLYTDQRPAGYFAIQIRPEEVFLSKLYVTRQSRRLGLAKNAIDFIKNVAADNCLNRISLTINKNNSDSLAAYERLGFKNEKAIVTDIGNGFYMDDYVLALEVG
ncbi:MAG: Acetyltransferase, GNAT family [Candidatus Rifleibacterium amylolyticum]|nr:MAG: Acetyltransferase, GNAT family [Candidatus Rifleibacterium amylolyticum]NLF98447.1 GNAT family N-acetyltransferase [Candidatus Riflebacteria bacterium]